MNITIISVGKIKEKYIKLGIDEFSKRLSRYCKLTMVEVPDEKTPDQASMREMELIKEINREFKKQGLSEEAHMACEYVVELKDEAWRDAI